MFKLIVTTLLLSLAPLAFASSVFEPGKLLTVEELGPLRVKGCEASIVATKWLRPKGNVIRRFRLVYATTDAHGKPTIASGLVTFQNQSDAVDRQIRYYHHATVVDRENVPSYMNYETSFATCRISAEDAVIVAPDMLGLGKSPGYHPYLHSESELSVSIDMLEASLQFFEDRNIELREEMVILGYSAGAHSSLLFHKYLEDNPDKHDFVVQETIAMSGPYDLVGLGKKPLFYDQPKNKSALFAAYILAGYQFVYGDVFGDLDEVFMDGFHDTLRVMGTQSRRKIKSFLPKYPYEFIKESYWKSVLADPDHPLNVALRTNSIIPWRADAPIQFIYSDSDKSVLPDHSREMAAAMDELGGSVRLRRVSKYLGHAYAYVPALMMAGKSLNDED